MATECSAECFDFGIVEGRPVEAAFDAGLVTSDAGALLLGATDRAIGMLDRFAACFRDERRADLIEHAVATLVGQRVFAIALGYEDLNDHDELRDDPMMAVLAGKLAARREDCAPVAGKSTLNRLELSKLEPTRYHKISHNPVAIRNLKAEDVKIRILGDFAIIHARTSYTMPDGQDAHGRYTDCWARQDGKWLAVSAHVSR